MQSIFDSLIYTLNTLAWSYILLPCVAIGGIYFSICCKGVQFTKFSYAIKNTVGKVFQKTTAGKGAITPFQAVTTALAATVGTGNIIGTGQAIALGGYGALFWLWIAALLGMVIKYSEVTLSVKYRERNENGDWVGGPMYYITNGMGQKWKWLAVLFSVFAVLASFGIGNLSQANSISGAVNNALALFFPSLANSRHIISLLVGIALAVICAIALFGGIKRIGRITSVFIPIMSILYIVLTVIVIMKNYACIPDALQKIIVGAFNPKAVFGAASGVALKEVVVWGLRRSAFSNEAGLGSAGMAHAAAETKSPVEQGMYGIFEVFVDTIVICTLTGFAIIVSSTKIPFGEKTGAQLITNAFATVFGDKFAALFVAVALTLFAFSTLLGWSLYGTRCIEYLFGVKAGTFYQIVFCFAVIVGATTSLDLVWNLADTFNGLMSIPNFIALFSLSGVVAKLTKEHFSKNKHKLK